MPWPAIVGELSKEAVNANAASDEPLARGWVHDALTLHLVVGGRGWYATGWEEPRTPIGPGDAFCLFPGARFAYGEETAAPLRALFVRIDASDPFSLAWDMGFSLVAPIHRPANLLRAIRCLRNLYEHHLDPESADPYQTLSLLTGLIAAFRSTGFGGAPRTDDERLVDEARVVIEDELGKGLGVAELAGQLGVSRQRLSTVFRDLLGTSPSDFIQRQRLGRAQFLLGRTDLKVAAIAREVGYGHEKHFYRSFRRLTGMTPRAFRLRERRSPDGRRS